MERSWLSAREAAALLDVKLATLYAYASRGLIESVPAPFGRGRSYAREDAERLKARHDARAGHGAVAAGALRWGEPTLETSVSEIRADGPYYRGQSALALARADAGFEAVCELLWTGTLGSTPWSTAPLPVALPASMKRAAPSIVRLSAFVACAALGQRGVATRDEHERARGLIRWLSARAGTQRPLAATASVAERLLHALGAPPRPRHASLLDRALVVCAEHELNASTFAARVTASTGADLYACVGSALHALSGPRHGEASARVEAWLREVRTPMAAARAVRDKTARGESVPGCGHPLYPQGDPRAILLCELARSLPGRRRGVALAEAVVDALHAHGLPAPNLDFGLVVFTQALGLPAGSAALIFALGRIAGWVAHALEQRRQGYLLRPRARYVAAG